MRYDDEDIGDIYHIEYNGNILISGTVIAHSSDMAAKKAFCKLRRSNKVDECDRINFTVIKLLDTESETRFNYVGSRWKKDTPQKFMTSRGEISITHKSEVKRVY